MSFPRLLLLFALGGCVDGWPWSEREGVPGTADGPAAPMRERAEIPPSTAPPLEEHAPVVVKRAKVESAGGVERTAAGDPDEIARTVRLKKGAIETCVQAALMRNRGMSGEIAASWTITGGTVSSVALTKNSTGDDELGACITMVVRRMRFDPSVTTTVDEWRWVVAGD